MADTQHRLSCEDLDQLFREGREYFNEIYVKKMAVNSVFYSRIDTQTWPMNTAPEQRGFRFGRGWYDPCGAWRSVESGRCTQNSCETNEEVIAHPGTESYTWTLFKKDMRTQWYCVTDWIHRLYPIEEISHIEATNANISKNVHEEFARAHFVGGSGYRWLGTVDATTSVSCDEMDSEGWRLETYSGEGEGSYNACYVYVKLPATELGNISQLSLDQLDDALISLQREDDAFRLDLAEAAGRPLLDIIIPDTRIGRNLWKYAKESGGWWDANTDFDNKQMQFALGIDRTIGNYAFSYDINGLRFNVDSVYNAGLAAFDAAVPATWPRLVRVLPYKPESIELGCKWVQNPDFNYADFAITIAWVPTALTKWVSPSFTGAGDAQIPVQNFAGEWEWMRPQWECNVYRDQGFFAARFRMGMQIKDPTIMHSFLHRLPKGKNLIGNCCDLNENYVAPANLDCYTCTGVEEGGEE